MGILIEGDKVPTESVLAAERFQLDGHVGRHLVRRCFRDAVDRISEVTLRRPEADIDDQGAAQRCHLRAACAEHTKAARTPASIMPVHRCGGCSQNGAAHRGQVIFPSAEVAAARQEEFVALVREWVRS